MKNPHEIPVAKVRDALLSQSYSPNNWNDAASGL